MGMLASSVPISSGPADHLLALVSDGAGGFNLKRVTPTNAISGVANDNGWTNTGIPISANYSVGDSDDGGTIYATANVGTVSFGAATGYASTKHVNKFYNGTARRWIIDVNGVTVEVWPYQTVDVFRVGNNWAYDAPGLWFGPATGVTFYVNHATGSDTTNDGLTSGSPFATITKAIQTLEFKVHCRGVGPSVQVLDTAFSADTLVHTYRLSGCHVLYLVGNHSTPSSCVWTVGTAGTGRTGMTCRDWSGIIVDGFKLVAANSACTFFSSSQHGIIDIWNIEFGAASGGIGVESANGGSVGYVVGATCTITGSCAIHWNVAGANFICTGVTITVSGSLTMTTFLQARLNAIVIFAGITFAGAGAGSGLTGSKYSADSGAQIILNSTVLPGATAGSASGATFAYAA